MQKSFWTFVRARATALALVSTLMLHSASAVAQENPDSSEDQAACSQSFQYWPEVSAGVGLLGMAAGSGIKGLAHTAETQVKVEHLVKRAFAWFFKGEPGVTAADKAFREELFKWTKKAKVAGRATFWVSFVLFAAGAYGSLKKTSAQLGDCYTGTEGAVDTHCYSKATKDGAADLTWHLFAGLTLGESKASAGDLEDSFVQDPSRLLTHPDRKQAEYYFTHSPRVRLAALAVLEEAIGSETQACEPMTGVMLKPAFIGSEALAAEPLPSPGNRGHEANQARE